MGTIDPNNATYQQARARSARWSDEVQTEAAKLNSVSFATCQASSSVSKGRTAMTGPTISCRAKSPSSAYFVTIIGGKKCPPATGR